MESLSAPRERPRILSVGTKLAGATAVLILLVAAGVYVALGRYELDNLFRTKEVAAFAVTKLFADWTVPAVEFTDEASINDELVSLGHNEEIEYAAIWAVNEDKIGPRLGELRRGAPETPTSVPADPELVRTPNRMTVLCPVRAPTGKPIGAVAVAFSLAKENAAIAVIKKRTLAISAGVAIGLTLLLLVVARFTIVRPLGKLARAARHLERGNVIDVDVHSNDEIGQLASAFRNMTRAIRSREEVIVARNRDMRLVLDNVDQGFITVDREGKMSRERSRIVDDWLGAPAEGMTFSEYLSRTDPMVGGMFELGWQSVLEDVLPLEVALDQLPRTLRKGSLPLELCYRPVMKGEQLTGALVVITDVTARLEREHAERAQREMVSIVHRMLNDRSAFDGFFSEAAMLVEAIVGADGSDLVQLKRDIHTLKGNAAFFGLERIAELCHGIEARMVESLLPPTEDEVTTLRDLWKSVTDARAQFAGSRRIELEPPEYDAFLTELRARNADHTLVQIVKSWKFEPAEKRLALLGEQVERLAARLGKHNVDVRAEPTKLRLPQERWAPFWSAFSHMVRNCVDHGVDSPAERAALGKSERATVSLGITRAEHQVVVSIGDDGRGIDWPAIARRAKAMGLPHDTQPELEEALFADGVSSRTEVTETSGRGVGLSAVRAFVHQFGGRIEIRTERGAGTTFRFILPDSTIETETAPISTEAARSSIRLAAS